MDGVCHPLLLIIISTIFLLTSSFFFMCFTKRLTVKRAETVALQAGSLSRRGTIQCLLEGVTQY